jgi:hypothetical protein
MLRQCAWCLRLINSEGDRLSPLPKPKLYEASHGICEICAMQCMQQLTLPDVPEYHKQDAIDRCIEKISREQQETTVSLRRRLQPQRAPHIISTRKVSKTNVH